MNNANNINRVVINLDGDLDDLDDDDITLPSLPAQSVTIIDEPALTTIHNQSVMDKPDNATNTTPPSASKIALGAPITAPSVQNIIQSDTPTVGRVADNITEQTLAPMMPLQAKLGNGASTHAASKQPSNTQVGNTQAGNTQDDNSRASEAASLEQANEPKGRQKGSWFNRMKSGLSKSRKNLAEGMVSILIGGKEIDDELLEEVEDQLLVADIGVNATNRIIKSLTEQTARGDLIYAHSLYKALQTELVDILTPKVAPLVIDTSKKPFVILVVGVNGVGKTTTIGKLAKRLQGEGKSVMLAAGDTFRAAATEQLQIWGERNEIPVVAQGHGSDSASVIFDAMQSAKAKNIDVLIADTAGRLQNKTHLMAELEKVVRVMRKSDPTAPHEGMIVLDAGTGQNAVNQVELFNEVVPLTGITITKLDGTAKGGVVFNIAETTDVPIRYIGVGESIDDLRAFSPKQFVAALFETDDKE